MSKQKFTRGVARKLGLNFVDGVTNANLGPLDLHKALAQHERYCAVLAQCGVELTLLEAESTFPDAPFVEDVAVLTDLSAIVTIPGHPSRQGEESKVVGLLEKFRPIKFIRTPGTVDGGDVLRIENHYYIGLSSRTNRDGAGQLADLLYEEGFTSSFVPVHNILHLKTGITAIGDTMVLAVQQFAEMVEFQKYNVLKIDADEAYAANCLSVNSNLLIPAGFPQVKSHLVSLGYIPIELDMSEFAKMDGGLTCLSILF